MKTQSEKYLEGLRESAKAASTWEGKVQCGTCHELADGVLNLFSIIEECERVNVLLEIERDAGITHKTTNDRAINRLVSLIGELYDALGIRQIRHGCWAQEVEYALHRIRELKGEG